MCILKSFKQTFRGKSKAWIQLSFGPALWVKRRFNQRGFSLVELMVVVAIIGILASIAIPNYQRFQRKSRQTEAKSSLSGIFTVQKTFNTEWGFGVTDFTQMGFALDGNNPVYNVGTVEGDKADGDFNASNTTAGKGSKHPAYRGPDPGTVVANTRDGRTHLKQLDDPQANMEKCTCTSTTACSPTCDLVGGGGSCVSMTTGTCTHSTGLKVPGEGDSFNNITFTFGAVGDLGGSLIDSWTINDNKTLSNVQQGL